MPPSPAVAVVPALRRQLRCLLAAHASLADGGSPVALHDLRVAARRARVILAALPLVEEPALQALATHLDALRDASGALRDLDVLLTQTLPGAIDDGLTAPPAALRQRLQHIRHAEHEHLQQALQTLPAVLTAAPVEDALVRHRHDPPPPAEQLQALLRRALQRVRKRSRHLRHDGHAGEHRLRIAVKKLRYALEAVGRGLDPDRAAAWRRRCRRLQDTLGALHDLEVAHTLLATHVADTAGQRWLQAFDDWARTAATAPRRRMQRQLHALRQAVSPWSGGGD